MIRFLFKGLLRDRSRSLFPVLVVLLGVVLTVFAHSWIVGVEENMVQANAHFQTGHVKVMTRSYARQSAQARNDLALLQVDSLVSALSHQHGDLYWMPRIRFNGLLDVPDENMETRAQTPVTGLAVDLLSPDSPEPGHLNLDESLVRGQVPSQAGEVLLSERLMRRLELNPGDTVTLIGSTLWGSMTVYNFTISGSVRFGMTALDRGALIADLADVRQALNMEDAAGEVLGFFRDDIYKDKRARQIAHSFGTPESAPPGEFTPVMVTLREQGGLGELLSMASSMSGIIIAIFVAAMSLVLWNAGLMGNIRRYGEIGMRLALGEEKGHLYRSLIGESLLIGLVGSVLGTGLGVAVSAYLQHNGIDISSMMEDSTILMSGVMRTRLTPVSAVIGFAPGLLATVLGSALSGLGIYRRQTSQLFKELET